MRNIETEGTGQNPTKNEEVPLRKTCKKQKNKKVSILAKNNNEAMNKIIAKNKASRESPI